MSHFDARPEFFNARSRRALAAVALLLPLAGCAASQSTSSLGASSAGAAASATSLIGTWREACGPTIAFAATTFTETGTLYTSGTPCGTKAVATISLSGTYSVGAASQAVSGATDLSAAFATAQITPESAEAAADFNEKGYCGIKNWVVGTPVTVAPSNACTGVTAGAIAAGQAQIFEIAGDTLYFGNSANTAIDTAQPWTRH
jgi:hypothetical protein